MAGIRKSSLLIVSTLMFTIIITSNVNARPQVRPHRSWNSDLNLNMIPESDDTRVKFHDDSIIAKEHRRVKKNMNNIESAVSSTSEKQDKSSGIQGETSNSESMTDSNSLKSEMPLTNQDAKREVVSNDKDPKIGSSTGIQSSNKSVSKLSSADGDATTFNI
ncbi:hypothetical protein C0J52_11587 [Blattella germanica]|nr:hypothetical protein C0J52_11587 [Blattella germanica]